MNERVPDSSGLPLRAMVMVLLFLGVIFLLVGFQAMGSSGNSGDDGSSVSTVSTTTMPPKKSAPAVPKAEVRVYNVSEQEGVAAHTADQLKADGYNVTAVDNLPSVSDVTKTTVYYTDAPGEHQTAEAVGKLLDAPVEPRIHDLDEQPPGVIVLVTG
ncbi:MAG: LytR C-terminal domain-containing protein [Mycobacterium sp.]